jgi:gliding motility-associatede transport system auxiliary component
MSRPGWHRLTAGAGALIALAVLFVGLTVLSNQLLRGVRLDLTEHRQYTLTPGTRHILETLSEPLNLYLFYSEHAASQVPVVRIYGQRVREFLQELAARSKGKVQLHVIDPQPFSEEEDRATEFGIRAVPLDSSGTSLYLGLAGTNSTDGRSVIDFLDPSKEPFLEYDVAKLLVELAQPKKPVIGWLSSIPMTGGFDPASSQQQPAWLVYTQAQQLFTVRTLSTTMSQVDPDIDVLVLVHPKDLPTTALYAIDQYALRGGRLLVFVDPIAEQDNGRPGAMMPGAGRASSLEPLLSAWGVSYDPNEVLGDLQQGLTVRLRPDEPPQRHIAIIAFKSRALAQGDVVTSGLTQITMDTTGVLRPKKDAGTNFEPLIQSSARAGLIPAQRFAQLTDPASLREGFKPTGEIYTVAARVTGIVKSAFPNGPPAGVPIAAGPAPLKVSSKPLNLIVAADADMLSDLLWIRWDNFLGQRTASAWANNGDFVWNALDNLAGSSDLISVRGRASFLRPFERVDTLRAAAEDHFLAEQKELEGQLAQTEQKLSALQTNRGESMSGAHASQSETILTADQERELQRFQKERLRIRKELRDVKLGLDRDIKALGDRLKLIDIVLAPAAFALIALLVAAAGRRRRRPAAAPSAASTSPLPATDG